MLYQQTANVHFLVPLDFSLSSGPPLPLFARKQINWCRQGVRVWRMFKVALNWNDMLVNLIPYIWKTNLTIHSFETTAQWTFARLRMILIYEDYVVELSSLHEKMSQSRGDLAYLRYYAVLLKLCLNMAKQVKKSRIDLKNI